MQNAVLNLMGMNGMQGNTLPSTIAGELNPSGGVSFREVLKAIGGNDTATPEMTAFIQTDTAEQPIVMPELSFDEKLDALLEKAEEFSPELAQIVKQVILEAVRVKDASNTDKTNSIDTILSGLTDTQKAEVKAFVRDILDLVKSGLDSTEADSGDILTAIGSVFERLKATSDTDDEQDSDTLADSAAEMLAAMVQICCADNSEIVQTVGNMISGNAEIPEIVSYLEKSGVSDNIVRQLAETADKQVLSQEKGKTPFELLSYKADNAQMSVSATVSVKAVTVSDELKQLLNQNSEQQDESENLSRNNADDFAAILPNAVQQMDNPVQTVPTAQDDVPFTQVSSQLVENLSAKLLEASQKDMTSEMKILLNPENLGEVAVKLVSENGSVSVMLSAANSEVAKMLSENLPALTAALQNQNVTVKDIAVIEPSDAASQMGFSFTSQNSGSERDNNTDNHRRVNGVFSLDTNEIDTEAVQSNEYENNPKGAKLWATA